MQNSICQSIINRKNLDVSAPDSPWVLDWFLFFISSIKPRAGERALQIEIAWELLSETGGISVRFWDDKTADFLPNICWNFWNNKMLWRSDADIETV